MTEQLITDFSNMTEDERIAYYTPCRFESLTFEHANCLTHCPINPKYIPFPTYRANVYAVAGEPSNIRLVSEYRKSQIQFFKDVYEVMKHKYSHYTEAEFDTFVLGEIPLWERDYDVILTFVKAIGIRAFKLLPTRLKTLEMLNAATQTQKNEDDIIASL